MRLFTGENIFKGMHFNVGSALSIGGSIAGSVISANAANKAADQESEAAGRAIDQANKRYNQTTKALSPYEQAGSSATNELSYLLGLSNNPTGQNVNSQNVSDAVKGIYASTKAGSEGQGIYYDPTSGTANLSGIGVDTGIKTVNSYDPTAFNSAINTALPGITSSLGSGSMDGAGGSLAKPFSESDFREDPGYQFALSQGQQALQRAQAAKGDLLSGAAVKALTDYNQGMADQQYGAAYDRYNTNQNNLYSRLTGLSTTGLNATNTQANAATNNASQVGGLLTDQGSAQAAGTIGSANAWQSGLANIGSSLNGTNSFSAPSGNTANGAASNFYSYLNSH